MSLNEAEFVSSLAQLTTLAKVGLEVKPAYHVISSFTLTSVWPEKLQEC